MKEFYILGLLAISQNIVQAQTISGRISDHDYVDLGLPSGCLWATNNVGANSPTEFGNYYAWGETFVKNNYSWSSYKWCDGSENSLTKYCFQEKNGTVDSLKEITNYDDVVVIEWGAGWRMPTRKELEELIDGCTWVWVNDYKGSGIPGRVGISNTNRNTIFFPAAGFCDSTVCLEKGVNGYYWSSSINIPYSMTAMDLVVSEPYFDYRNLERCYGLPIRAVSK